MKLKLLRLEFTDESTIGELFVDNAHECWTLEDKVRPAGEKIHGQTAIPAGTYRVIIDFSNRFKRLMPHLLDVPNFAGIRIHSGNRAKDTEGCIILGKVKGEDFVGESRLAYSEFLPKLEAAFKEDEVWIEIIGGSR